MITLNIRTFQICASLFSLIVGGIIYLLFRSTSLLMFSWVTRMNLIEELYHIRNNYTSKVLLDDWIIYSLPDGLWIFSLESTLLFIWQNELNRKNVIFILGLPLILMSSELAQYFLLMQGTFDFLDLIVYVIGFSLSLLIFLKA